MRMSPGFKRGKKGIRGIRREAYGVQFRLGNQMDGESVQNSVGARNERADRKRTGESSDNPDGGQTTIRPT